MKSVIPLLIAHRGVSSEAPENTLAAFRLAWEQGADGIEGDFRLTADGHIVCLHDASTRRTGDRDLLASSSTLAELKQADLGSWKGPQWAGERIPTLEEVLDLLPPGKQFFLEVKCGPEIVPPLKKLLAARPAVIPQLSVIAFDPRVITTMRAELPQVTANWLTEFHYDDITAEWHPTGPEVALALTELGSPGVGVQSNPLAVDEEFARALQAKNFTLHVWTVDELELAQHFIRVGFHSLTSNRPGALRKELESVNGQWTMDN